MNKNSKANNVYQMSNFIILNDIVNVMNYAFIITYNLN